jgi:hypothetical protein
MRRSLVAITLFGLLVRAAFLALEPQVDRRGDEPSWLDMAEHGLAKARPPLSPWSPRILFYPPLYPYFLATGYRFSGGHDAALWAQVVVSALLITAVGLLGMRAFSKRTGFWAALAVACHPELVWFAAHYWSETMFLTLVCWGLERSLAADEAGRAGPALASGLLIGLATLTRETALPMTLLAAGWHAWPGRAGRPGGAGRGALLLLGATLAIGPWTLRNWVLFKAFIPVSTYGALNLWVGNSSLDRDEVYRQSDLAPGPVAQYRLARQRAWEEIARRQPGWIFEKIGQELPRFLAVSSEGLVFVEEGAYGHVSAPTQLLLRFLGGVPWVLVALLGVPALALLRTTRARGLLLAFLLCLVAQHVAAFGHHRFHLPLEPLLALWATSLFGEERPADRWRAPVAALLALGVLLCWGWPSSEGRTDRPGAARMERLRAPTAAVF